MRHDPSRPLAAWVAAGLALLALTPAGRADLIVEVTKVGNPDWAPVDFHLFSAPSEPLSAALRTARSILPPPHHIFTNNGIIIPGTPHAGPYDVEIAKGLARAGLHDQTQFGIGNFSGQPNGIWLAYMLVPHPGTVGSSPDFARGPIIPESVFPILGTLEVFRDGSLFDVSVVRTRKLSQLPVTPPFQVDGSSHRPQFFDEDLLTSLNPLHLQPIDLPGHYVFDLRLRDAQGAGFNLAVPFDVVVPEPGTLLLFAVGGVGLLGGRRLRRRGAGKLGG
jgi:hypothetical protein